MTILDQRIYLHYAADKNRYLVSVNYTNMQHENQFGWYKYQTKQQNHISTAFLVKTIINGVSIIA